MRKYTNLDVRHYAGARSEEVTTKYTKNAKRRGPRMTPKTNWRRWTTDYTDLPAVRAGLAVPALPFGRPAVGYLAPLGSRIKASAAKSIRGIRGPFPLAAFHKLMGPDLMKSG
jgi:hypothetical protein